MFGKIRIMDLSLCNFERWKYGRRKFRGRVCSEHGTESGLKNDRLDIPEDRHGEIKGISKPGNIDIYMGKEISSGNSAFWNNRAAVYFDA